MPKKTDTIDLINSNTKTALYKSLTVAHQDGDWLSLAEHPAGLFSDAFSICYALIIRNKDNPKQATLWHVSSFDSDDIESYQGMIDEVGGNGQFTLELARSKQGYADQYEIESKLTEMQAPDDLFNERDEEYRNFFAEHFGITPLRHEMPAATIVIRADGQLDLLEEHRFDSLLTKNAKRKHQSLSGNPDALFHSKKAKITSATQGVSADPSLTGNRTDDYPSKQSNSGLNTNV